MKTFSFQYILRSLYFSTNLLTSKSSNHKHYRRKHVSGTQVLKYVNLYTYSTIVCISDTLASDGTPELIELNQWDEMLDALRRRIGVSIQLIKMILSLM